MPNLTTTQTTGAALALALGAALAMVHTTAAAQSDNMDKEKCFGVAVAGENGCAAADGSHGCGGLSTVDYSGKEWVLVEGGSCDKMGGRLEAFDGIGKPPATSDAKPATSGANTEKKK